MTGRENKEAKARRYLCEGRLIVTAVDSSSIEATCRGGGDVYALGCDRGYWWCGCSAVGECSHVVALKLITRRPQESVAPY